jgi:hypothetical protein
MRGKKSDKTKEYIERRHGEPFEFLFLPKQKARPVLKNLIMKN